jgi:ferredoxin
MERNLSNMSLDNKIKKKNIKPISNCEEVIKEDYCIGCGACTIGDTESTINFDDNGFYKPKLSGQ